MVAGCGHAGKAGSKQSGSVVAIVGSVHGPIRIAGEGALQGNRRLGIQVTPDGVKPLWVGSLRQAKGKNPKIAAGGAKLADSGRMMDCRGETVGSPDQIFPCNLSAARYIA